MTTGYLAENPRGPFAIVFDYADARGRAVRLAIAEALRDGNTFRSAPGSKIILRVFGHPTPRGRPRRRMDLALKAVRMFDAGAPLREVHAMLNAAFEAMGRPTLEAPRPYPEDDNPHHLGAARWVRAGREFNATARSEGYSELVRENGLWRAFTVKNGSRRPCRFVQPPRTA